MNYLPRIFLVMIAVFVFAPVASSQTMDRIARDHFKEMLTNIRDAIKKNYYDSNYRGIDLNARFKKAEERLTEVSTAAQANAVIAQVLVDFNDSHLYYLPPAMTVDVVYGFRMQMVGDRAFVTSVKPKSDAEKKGLKPGDQILSFEGFKPSRKELWKVNYFYYTLSPRGKLRLNVLKPGATSPADLEIIAKTENKRRVLNLTNTFDVNEYVRESEDFAARDVYYIVTAGDTVMWKMLTFAVDPTMAADVMDAKVKKAQNLILDLRGNGGGYVKTLEELAGWFFDKDMKIADRKGRPEKKKENEPMLLKSKGKNAFSGKLVVLIDHESGSASEIFARFIQLEKRGVVLGDVSAGAVMQSMSHPFKMTTGIDREIYYGASITNADVLMSDGKSIEHVGVTPDEMIIPTPEDMAAGRDPVLARALEIIGVKATPAEAGKFFEKAKQWEDN